MVILPAQTRRLVLPQDGPPRGCEACSEPFAHRRGVRESTRLVRRTARSKCASFLVLLLPCSLAACFGDLTAPGNRELGVGTYRYQGTVLIGGRRSERRIGRMTVLSVEPELKVIWSVSGYRPEPPVAPSRTDTGYSIAAYSEWLVRDWYPLVTHRIQVGRRGRITCSASFQQFTWIGTLTNTVECSLEPVP